MDPVALTSYVAIVLGGLSGLLAIAVVGKAFLGRRAKAAEARPVMRPSMIMLGAALLFVFGGGYGLQGLTTASSVLQDLAQIISGDAGSERHRASTERLVEKAANGELSEDQQALLRAAVLENPHEDADSLLKAAGGKAATQESKKNLEGLQTELAQRVSTAAKAAEAAEAAKPPGSAPIDAVKALPPETLRYLRAAPDASLQKIRIDPKAVRALPRIRRP